MLGLPAQGVRRGRRSCQARGISEEPARASACPAHSPSPHRAVGVLGRCAHTPLIPRASETVCERPRRILAPSPHGCWRCCVSAWLSQIRRVHWGGADGWVPVFKAAALDRSATPPGWIMRFSGCSNVRSKRPLYEQSRLRSMNLAEPCRSWGERGCLQGSWDVFEPGTCLGDVRHSDAHMIHAAHTGNGVLVSPGSRNVRRQRRTAEPLPP
jgi:hypothetical protein